MRVVLEGVTMRLSAGIFPSTIGVVSLVALTFVACGSDDSGPKISNFGEDTSTAAGDVGHSVRRDAKGKEASFADGGGAPDESCVPECQGKLCGSDGCNGTCGQCRSGEECVLGACLSVCDSDQCPLGNRCSSQGRTGLCAGSINFDVDPDGQPMPANSNVEQMFAVAGVVFYTDSDGSIAATNPYELASASGHNSCASIDGWSNYWQDAIIARFVVPSPGSLVQGATDSVSLYIGKTWPGGVVVEFYQPTNPPGVPGSSHFHEEVTDSEGTDFVEYKSQIPIGYVKVRSGQDPDLTIDDFSFGPIFVPSYK